MRNIKNKATKEKRWQSRNETIDITENRIAMLNSSSVIYCIVYLLCSNRFFGCMLTGPTYCTA